ncbi:MAG: adenylate/guanylate cyclase domain-containing protein [Armatimonadota bacterium]|nr:adenylate/guanylate cyclase domain-containing protein [Armatimonadota bacterium]MDR7497170.1 adenylate/guanylate cyclase domain-containing protein [Armatimonadota bacterium]
MSERRLAAIMFTDMVGYSALTQRDEELALELLDEHRRLLRPVFAAHGGRVIDMAGDGFLLEFASALAAVRGAIDAQRALEDRNAAAPPEHQILIRIGIHLGDVVFTEGDAYGDGVNIAARLEPVAEPGGICVSQQVYDQVAGKIDLPLESMGKPALKNIRTPVEVYRVVLASRPAAADPDPARSVPGEAPPAPAPAAKSIAVLPLANLSPDPENEYFSDGLTDDILAQLSKIRGLKVISRTSAMQYKRTAKNVREIGRELGVATILEGSVRKAGNTVRISVQLIDAATDEHLWADTYDRELADIFAIQSEVARRIADALQARASPEERARIDRRPTSSLEAYQAYLRGLFLWNQRTDASVNAGIEQFRRALALDPEYAPAHVGLAESYIVLGNFGTYRPAAIYPAARAASLRALEIDEALGDAHASLAQVKLSYDWDWAGAEQAFRRAIELRPGSANAHHWYALYLSAMGRSDEALGEIGRARELDPLSAAIGTNVAAILFSARRYDQALVAAREAVALHPEFRIAHVYLGTILLLTGAYADALAALQKADEPAPGTNVLTTAMLGYARARLGYREQAVQTAAGLADRYRRAYASPVWIAFLHQGLGDPAQTLAWLDRACRDRDGWLRLLGTSPFFDDIRDAPEYLRVLGTMGLAPGTPERQSS